MKLINFKNVKQFNTLREKMGAEYIQWSTASWEEREKEKIDIQIDQGTYDVENLDELTSGKNGVLQHNGRAVMVYIPGSMTSRYHLSNCRTLGTMKAQGRYERYVLTRRTDGKFLTKTKYGEQLYKLSACKNCLRDLGYSMSESDNFDIEGHFNSYDTKPSEKIRTTRYTDENIPINDYTSDFKEVSKQHRANDNFKCQECGLNLSHPSAQRFLHTHHKNGNKFDNSSSNLRSLCVECHSKQAGHGHMIVPQEFRNAIGKLRN